MVTWASVLKSASNGLGSDGSSISAMLLKLSMLSPHSEQPVCAPKQIDRSQVQDTSSGTGPRTSARPRRRDSTQLKKESRQQT